jgi:CheY-like chemotaxis protein/nitrogen-specific signal transduction histidine kinase
MENEITTRTREALKENFLVFTQSDDENCTGSFSIVLSDAAVYHYNYFLIKNNPRSDLKNICCVLTDVTDYVEMSRNALASNIAKGEFLSKMSHEIRTPMNAIIGMTEIARRQTDVDKIMGNLDNIQSSSSHLLKLINDILDISKIESGKIEISHVVFDLNKALSDISAISGKLASDKHIDLKIDLKNNINSPLLFYGDEVRIKQVLINLLSNAIKFSPIESEVRFDVIPENGGFENTTKIYFSITDQGIGIAPDKTESIFEAFEQGGVDITRNFGGTGLGLPISNTLVQLMGGDKIHVSSELGKGSIFYFTLDFENAEIVNNTANASDENGGDSDNSDESADIDFTGKRLLLVDDIEINREIVISFLEGSGIEIDCCDDGTVAVEKFSESTENYYALIFMDIQMKIMDGYTASKTIRALNRGDASSVKIIGLSANAFQSDIDDAYSAGMNDYIVKPIDYNNMIKKMKKYLGGY